MTAVESALIYTAELASRAKGHPTEVLTHGKGIVIDGDHAGGDLYFGDVGMIECAVSQ